LRELERWLAAYKDVENASSVPFKTLAVTEALFNGWSADQLSDGKAV
jgi:hypothetical protein